MLPAFCGKPWRVELMQATRCSGVLFNSGKRGSLSLGLRLHKKEVREGKNISSIEAKGGNTASCLKEGLVCYYV